MGGEISCIAKNTAGEAKCSAKFALEGAGEDVITPAAVQTTQTAAQESIEGQRTEFDVNQIHDKEKPKLRKVKGKDAAKDETPLEKLKRLENAKPLENEEEVKEVKTTELPEYNLPQKRDKTKLETLAERGRNDAVKEKTNDESQSNEWEKMKKQQVNPKNDENAMILGKGKKPDKEGDDAIKLKVSQKSAPKDPESSVKLKSLDVTGGEKIADHGPEESIQEPLMLEKQKQPPATQAIKKVHATKDKPEVGMDGKKPEGSIHTDEKKGVDDDQPSKKPGVKSDGRAGKRPEKKSEKTIPTKETPDGIVVKPKLKATGKAKVEESPLEKLKRLENAKPTEVEESEPEEDYVSELPTYNLPTKREKTDLEQFDTPEKMKLQKSKSKKIEPSPEWEKLKKKPENEKDPHGFLLGKGSIPDDDQENDLKLKKKQNPPPKDVDDTMNLKPFSKPSDEVQTPSEEASYSSPVIDQKDQRKKGDGIVDKPKLKSTSPTEIRKEDDQDD